MSSPYLTDHKNLSKKDYKVLRPAEVYAYEHCTFYRIWEVLGGGKSNYHRCASLPEAVAIAQQLPRALIYAGAIQPDGQEVYCHVAYRRVNNVKVC